MTEISNKFVKMTVICGSRVELFDLAYNDLMNLLLQDKEREFRKAILCLDLEYNTIIESCTIVFNSEYEVKDNEALYHKFKRSLSYLDDTKVKVVETSGFKVKESEHIERGVYLENLIRSRLQMIFNNIKGKTPVFNGQVLTELLAKAPFGQIVKHKVGASACMAMLSYEIDEESGYVTDISLTLKFKYQSYTNPLCLFSLFKNYNDAKEEGMLKS